MNRVLNIMGISVFYLPLLFFRDAPLRRPDPEAVRHPRGLDLDGGAEEGAVAAAAGEVLKGFFCFYFAGIARVTFFSFFMALSYIHLCL